MTSLIADLENIAAKLPPSHIPPLHSVAQVLGALALVVEHGDAILDASRDTEHPDAVLELLTEHADRVNQDVARQLGVQAPQAGQYAQQVPATFGQAPIPPANLQQVPGQFPGQQAPGFQPSAPPAYPTTPGAGAPSGFVPVEQFQDFPPGSFQQPAQAQAAGSPASPSYAELVGIIQSLQAQLAATDRPTVESSAPREQDGDQVGEDRPEPAPGPADPVPAPTPHPGGESA